MVNSLLITCINPIGGLDNLTLSVSVMMVILFVFALEQLHDIGTTYVYFLNVKTVSIIV